MGYIESPDTLWQAFAATRDPALRERLITHYAPLVRYVIGRMGIHAPALLTSEDLQSIGIVGLIEAVDRFDPSRGVAFQTFAVQRIRGQIQDALRQQDPLTRSARRSAREIDEAIAALEREQGGAPSDQAIAARANLTLEEYYQVLSRIHISFVSLDEAGRDDADDDLPPLSERVPDPRATMQPEVEAERHERAAALTAALAEMSGREKLVLQLYYYEDLTLREISRILQVSEPRVSQIHGRALLRLRNRLRAQRVFAPAASAGLPAVPHFQGMKG